MDKIIAFFEHPQAGKYLRYFFYGILVLLIISEFLIDKHPYFSFAAMPTFYALFGFLSCVLIVLAANILGKIWLQKGEDYYD